MPDNSMVKKVYEWSPALTRMKITNWKDCIRNRIKWKKLVEKSKTSLKL
jgi:hypothetical protein